MQKLHVVLTAYIFLMSACVSTPKPTSIGPQRQGVWSAKAQIYNKTNGEKQQVSFDIISVWPDRMRMEVGGTMGVALATVTMKQSQIQYSLYRQKKFFTGNLSEKSLLPLFHVQLNPAWLFNICFDQPIQQAGWSCEKNQNEQISRCKNSQYEILWNHNDGPLKKINLQSDQFEIKIVFKDFSPEIKTNEENLSEIFELTPPSGFSRYKLH